MTELGDKLGGSFGFANDFRRRILAGLVVLVALVAPGLQDAAVEGTMSAQFISLLTSPVIAVLGLATVYMLGVLVEILGDVILARLAGNYVWAFLVPWTWFSTVGEPLRFLLRAVVWVPGGIVLAYFFVARAFIGKSDFRWLNSRATFSPEAGDYLSSLPTSVKAGLQEPFGDRQEFAWKFLQNAAGRAGADWIATLENRNRDVLTIVTALMLAVIAGVGMAFTGHRLSGLSGRLAFALQLTLLVLSWTYFVALKKSMIAAIEWAAIASRSSTIGEPTNRAYQDRFPPAGSEIDHDLIE